MDSHNITPSDVSELWFGFGILRLICALPGVCFPLRWHTKGSPSNVSFVKPSPATSRHWFYSTTQIKECIARFKMHKSIPYMPSHSKKNLYINISNIVSEHKVIEFQNNYDTIQNSCCIKKVKIYFLQFCPRLTPHVYWCDQRTYLVYLAFVAVKRHLTPRSSVILALNTGGTCCIFSLPMCLSLWTYFPKHLSYLCI